MSTRTLLIGFLTVAAGAAAAVGVGQLVKQLEPPDLDETVNVVTVAMEVPRGEMLSRERLTVEQWPKDHVPEETLKTVDEALGRVALAPLYKGQPVNDNLLALRDVPAGLASLVPDGMRAFTIHTPTIASGVAGFVLPGNYVDILLTVSSRTSLSREVGGGVTVILLQRVEILAVDQNLDAPTQNRVDAKSLKSVTLLVTPEQASKLSLAQNKGVLELSLRNPGDEAPVVAGAITSADLQYLGELPLTDEPTESDEERVGRLVMERLAEREAEMEKMQAEREEALKAEMLALGEEFQREMDSARAEFAKAQAAPQPAVEARPKKPNVLAIRTLRGTHSGVVLVKPGSGSRNNSVARKLDN